MQTRMKEIIHLAIMTHLISHLNSSMQTRTKHNSEFIHSAHTLYCSRNTQRPTPRAKWSKVLILAVSSSRHLRQVQFSSH